MSIKKWREKKKRKVTGEKETRGVTSENHQEPVKFGFGVAHIQLEPRTVET